jgi:hypothetical protein
MERGERQAPADDLVRRVARVLHVRPGNVKAAIEVARRAAARPAGVYLVYKAFGAGVEPQVIGIGSTREQAIRLAEQHLDQEQYEWLDAGWSASDVGRLSRLALAFPDRKPVEIRAQRVELDKIDLFALKRDALVEEDGDADSE